MSFRLSYTVSARDQFQAVAAKDPQKHRKVVKCLRLLSNDPKYPGLNSHRYHELAGENGEEVWESYVENNTPAAWRVFWHYGPDQGEITVLAITPHP